MAQASLRSALRAETSDLHDQLDQQVGEFASEEGYADYVVNTHRFRSTIEPRLPSSVLWQVTPLTPALGEDLRDLGRLPDVQAAPPFDFSDENGAIGAFYVLEGSGVGARILLKRARALGMSENHGARHLTLQAGDTARWPQFLAILEKTPPERYDAIIAASLATFRLALETYSQTAS
ncbi:heme oxygenase [Devosia crocina]|uniref:Heme oxygenase n=1 Tax=Devosia crocina TaxID=429728 RepID=A0A1I7N335_9HYPH|nr:biliverdin-producing heme oxygenase [Devosia crocina]SFV28966.1 heme oxygenase [Devosia crocina]